MLTATILFSVLTVLAQAAPLPMPAVKQSNKLASRFYNHPESILYHQTPCWDNGLEGVLQDDVCVLAALDVGRTYSPQGYRPDLTSGQPCTQNGRQGIWQDTTCILADVDLNLTKKSILSNPSFGPNEPCLLHGQKGHYRDGLCDILGLDLDLDVNDGPDFIHDRRPVYHLPTSGDDCWLDGQHGFWRDDLCILADLNIAKRYVPYQSEGVVGEVVDTLTGSRDYPHHYPRSTLPLPVEGDDSFLSADALLEVIPGNSHSGFLKRNGVLHNAPDDNIVDGAVRTLTQIVDHTTTKRGLLGLGDGGDLLGGESRPTYTSEYNHRAQHDQDNDVLDGVEAALDVDVDTDDQPYYGTHGREGLAGLPIKRDILKNGGGGGGGGLNVLSSITGVLSPSNNDRYVNSDPHIIHSGPPTLDPFPYQTDDLLAQVNVDSTLDLDNVSTYPSGSRYIPSYDRNDNLGGILPIPGSNHGHLLGGGLIKRDLGGLDNVNGLGLDKITSSGGDMPVVADLLGDNGIAGAQDGLPVVGGGGKKGGLIPGLL
ncbi:hypothetical protein IAR55_002156 [Kwoniella newhampshirensis]|uniref:Uncharacterized protein n=1 Tax=Kwoniella newhampshirensis TaxID=1651941 RepID=A0AAW0YQD0_9TREE